MAKILTDKEVIDIINRAPDEIEERDTYVHFLEDLGNLVADYFGGERGGVNYVEHDNEYLVAFHVNECVPDDGGVYAKYDTDVTWNEGMEE